MYLALGWVAMVAMPQLFARLGVTGGLLLVAGGPVYSTGAAVYGLRRPDPVPAVLGYHEVFHLLVIAGSPPTSWPSACSSCHPAERIRCGGPCSCGGPPTVVGRLGAVRLRRR